MVDIRGFFGKGAAAKPQSAKSVESQELEDEDEVAVKRRTPKRVQLIEESDEEYDTKQKVKKHKEESPTKAQLPKESLVKSPKKKATPVAKSEHIKETSASDYFSKSKPTTGAKAGKQPEVVVLDDDNMMDVDANDNLPPVQETAKSPQKKAVSTAKVTAESKDEEESAPDSAKKKFNYFQYKNRTGPKHPGSKPIPTGAENCLEGFTFVFTGELDSLSRDEASDLVKRYGGRITSAVSGKTDYLVAGDDAGESKVAKARSVGVKVVSEDELLHLIATLPGKTSKYQIASAEPVSPHKKSAPSAKSPRKMAEIDSEMTQSTSTQTKEKSQPSTSASSVPAASPAASPAVASTSKPIETSLWTEIYKPASSKEILGNPGVVSKLSEWLRAFNSSWPGTKGSQDSGHGFKAALLSGPPGIGKTTTAHLIAKEVGFDVLEFNASDARSKKILDALLGDTIKNHAITEFTSTTVSSASTSKKAAGSEGKHQLLVMDEVDGMSSGDRGGMAELIQFIKKTRMPIICICNDRYNPKIRSLSQYCFDLRFRRPTVQQILSRMMTVAFREKLQISPNAMSEVIQATQSDIRQVLNTLSAWRLRASSMNFDEAKQIASGASKDFDMGPFDIIRKFLSAAEFDRCNLNELIGFYFYDYSLIPLMVQENYLRVIPSAVQDGNPKERVAQMLDRISRAADAISASDLIDNRIRRTQDWSLSPAHAFMSCVYPASQVKGGLKEQPIFPGWLGQNSKEGKAWRMMKELYVHLRFRAGADKLELRLSYLPVLRRSLIHPLIERGADAITGVVETMDYYYLNREDIEWLEELCFEDKQVNFARVDSKVKAAFTRQYNQGSHPLPYPAAGLMSGRRGAVGAGPAISPDEEGAEPEEAAEDEGDNEASEGEEDIGADKMIVAKKAKAAGAGASSRGGSSRGRGRGGRGRGARASSQVENVDSD